MQRARVSVLISLSYTTAALKDRTFLTYRIHSPCRISLAGTVTGLSPPSFCFQPMPPAANLSLPGAGFKPQKTFSKSVLMV